MSCRSPTERYVSGNFKPFMEAFFASCTSCNHIFFLIWLPYRVGALS